MKADETIIQCKNCKAIITDEDYITLFEPRGEYKGSEEIIIGYKCKVCGHKEEY